MSSYNVNENMSGVLDAVLATPWNAQIAAQMYKINPDKTLKSFTGASGYNTGLIDRIKSQHDYAIRAGVPEGEILDYVSQTAKTTPEIVASYLKAIKLKLPDPKDDLIKWLKIGVVVIGIGALAYFLAQVRSFVPARQ